MKEFIELHDFEEGSPIMIGIDDIEAVYESDEVEDALVIQVNDGLYNVKESYFELKKFLSPAMLESNNDKIIKIKTDIDQDTIDELIRALSRS